MQGDVSNAGEFSSATIIVKGRVQGVYFRRFTADNAGRLGLTGFARNLPDGSVEVFAEGKKSSIEKLVDLLHIGPSLARVESLNTEWSDYSATYQDFSIKR